MDIEAYLSSFGDVSGLERKVLIKEMDGAWDNLGLSNSKPLKDQYHQAKRFYSHPVWILNGLFSERDDTSRNHRISIAKYVASLSVERVADYGGGAGVLARFIVENGDGITVDIVEPYPSPYFLERMKKTERVRYVPLPRGPYDLVIAQDVLEHVDEPLELAVQLVEATRMNGHLIFANNFHPEMKCHLPSTFYLRNTFKILMRCAGLRFVEPIPGARHAHVFRREGVVNRHRLLKVDAWAKIFGPSINELRRLASQGKSALFRL